MGISRKQADFVIVDDPFWSGGAGWEEALRDVARLVVKLTPAGESLPEGAILALQRRAGIEDKLCAGYSRILLAEVKRCRRGRKLELSAKKGGIAYWNRHQEKTMRKKKKGKDAS